MIFAEKNPTKAASNNASRADVWLARLAVALFLLFPLSAALSNTVWGILVVVWFIVRLRQGRTAAAFKNPVGILCLALYSIVVLGALHFSAPWDDIWQHLRKYGKLLLIPIVVDIINSSGARRRCENAFGIACGIVIFITLLNYFRLPDRSDIGALSNAALFGDYLVQSILMAGFVILAVTRALADWKHHKILALCWLLGGSLAVMCNLYLSIGRTGAVMLMIGAATLTLVRIRPLKLAVCCAAISVAITTLAVITSPALSSRCNDFKVEWQNAERDKFSSTGHRLYNFQTGIQLFIQRPLIGWGTGAYHSKICDVMPDPGRCDHFNWHPHNQFLFFGIEHGLLGIFLYVALLMALAARALQHTEAALRASGLAFIAMLAVNSLFNSPLWSGRESLMFLLLSALLIATNATRPTRVTAPQPQPAAPA
jgi:O-antigen ligase